MRTWLSLESLALAALLTATPFAGSAANVRWEALNDGGGGCNGTIYSVISSGDSLFVAGSFTVMGDVAANNIALWDGRAWHALGKGIDDGFSINGVIRSLAFDQKGGLYAGGRFSSAGDVRASNIAHWDGKTWSSLSDSTNRDVLNLQVSPGGELYAGGYFSVIGGKAIKGVARWDGKSWSALGLGVNSLITQLVLDRSGSIIASGLFDSAGGNPIKGLARYSNGTWSSLGGRASTTDTKLMLDRDGGLIATNLDTGLLAKWNGTKWDSITTKGLEFRDVWNQATNEFPGMTRDSVGTLWIAGRRKTPSDHQCIRWSLTPSGWVAENGIGGRPYGIATSSNGHVLVFGDGFVGGGFYSSSRTVENAGLLDYSNPQNFGSGFLRSEIYTGRNQVRVDAQGHVFVMAPTFLDGKKEFLMEWDGTSWKGLSEGIALSTAQSLADLAVGGDGSLFIAGWGKIYRRDPIKKQWEMIGTYPASIGQQLDADAVGNLYVGGDFSKISGVDIRYAGFWDVKSRTWSAIENPVPSDTSFKTQRIKLLPDGRLALAGYADTLKSHKFGIWDPMTKQWTVDAGSIPARYTEDLQVSPSGSICRVLHYGIDDYSFSCRKADSALASWGTYGADGAMVPLRIAIDAQDNVYGFIRGTTLQNPTAGVLQPSRYNRKLKIWEPLGSGVNHENTLIFNGSELNETVALDPTGKRLYALGNFTMAGGVISPWIATADVADLSSDAITAPTSPGRKDMLRLTRQGIVLSPAWLGPVDVSIFDLQGRRIWSTATNPAAMTPYPALASGAYLVRARSTTQSYQSSLIRP
jgi:hypothetical protein